MKGRMTGLIQQAIRGTETSDGKIDGAMRLDFTLSGKLDGTAATGRELKGKLSMQISERHANELMLGRPLTFTMSDELEEQEPAPRAAGASSMSFPRPDGRTFSEVLREELDIAMREYAGTTHDLFEQHVDSQCAANRESLRCCIEPQHPKYGALLDYLASKMAERI